MYGKVNGKVSRKPDQKLNKRSCPNNKTEVKFGFNIPILPFY
jgi:hypothetical protein